ncbi:MAG: protein phosphatase 2C domain-containing protein [Symploca sp. SIO2B6]|nr:protein phosphatase 2C domain-containing protein [Symploca sp. SIO2B6]
MKKPLASGDSAVMWSEIEIKQLVKAIIWKLGLNSQQEQESTDNKFTDLLHKFTAALDSTKTDQLQSKLRQELSEVLLKKSSEASPLPNAHPESEPQQDPKQNTPSVITAVWKYLPVPEKPDKHDEFDSKHENPPGNLKLIGARVRGKGHKHEGTNCDDWFELVVSGSWTIIAVSDGAGSKKFSRVGAKVSCEAACQLLAQELKEYQLQERDEWSVDTFKRDQTTGAFAQQDLEFVQQKLHKAVKAAYEAVEKAAMARNNSVDHYQILGNRRLNIKDLSATLLLAVHTIVSYKENDYSFVLTCQVGDGMIAAVDHNYELQLLCQPDKGEFAGQTEFLTSKNKLEKNNLIGNTFPFFSPIKALMVMTDGVAEDYFPYNPRMLELYGDLLLNQVIETPQADDEDIANQLRQTNLGSIAGVEEAKDKFISTEKRIMAAQATDEAKTVCIRSVADYAKELDVSLSKVIANHTLLWAGSNGETMWKQGKNQSPEEKLRIWLDSYYRRASFDDRTLTILYREVIK